MPWRAASPIFSCMDPRFKSAAAPDAAASRRARAPARGAPALPGAARERRHRLAGIEQATRIEGALHREERLQLVGAELQAHLVDLLDADPMLAGNGAAHLDAFLHD